MNKNYFYILLLLSFLFSYSLQAQENKSSIATKTQEPTIEGLTIYPNPVNSGKIFITTKSSLDKKVEIFNVLGKKVLETVITSKEVNIGQLEAGIYIIKIKEGDASATRKLIVN
ncbi:MAG: T9SS type A sorting domain-containing protein [Flavobacterium sp.]|nr:T9SS type A sorting domain-containing protein [Flavobacterium sp.]